MGLKIGISDLHYAIMTSDEADATPVYEAPVKIPGVVSVNINPNASIETLFADDGPYDSAGTLGQIEVEIVTADLDLDTQATLLGHTVTADGMLKRKADDVPPYIAIGFKSLKSNGKYRYTWLAKGKFVPSEMNVETKGDTVNFQTASITGNFLKRASDNEWERHIDEDHPDWVQAHSDNWFTSPIYLD
jgi:phi13 family phage major tail protein